MNIIYTKPNCTFCTYAKGLMQKLEMEYEERVIGVDIERDSFLTEFPEVKTVPFLVINGEKVYGYESLRDRYEQENNR